MAKLTVNEALALIQEQIDKQGDSPFKNLARRQATQLSSTIVKLGIGGTEILSLPKPSPRSGTPLSAPRGGRVEQRNASTIGNKAKD